MNKNGARLLLATSSLALATIAQAGVTTTYTYDALGRLVGVSTSGDVNNGLATSVNYDPAGNRTSYWTGTGSPPPPPPPSPPPPSPPPPPPPSPPPPPPPPPSNQPPVTHPDTLTVQMCQAGFVNVVANDTDPEGNVPITLIGVTQGALGTALISNSSTVGYNAYSTTGTDTITYTVKDSLGAQSTGTLTVTVVPGDCSIGP